jgi:2-dehydropantoate 2-reductase
LTRVIIVGAGAMGSLFAAHLAKTRAEVWVYDSWHEHIAAITANGLIIRRGSEQISIPLRATTKPAEPGEATILMIFVKYGQTSAALAAALPMIGERTLIVTLQNGLGNLELIRNALPTNRILYGLTTLTSELLGPGRIEASFMGMGETYLWPEDGNCDAAVKHVCELLYSGGINTTASQDITAKIWRKLIVNCCYNTLCAITDLPVGALIDRSEIWPLLDGTVDEIVAAARGNEIRIDAMEARAFLRKVGLEARGHYPSMLIDVRNRRQTEIECLNGAVLRECDRLGILAPFNRALYGIIRVIEQSYAARGLTAD